VANQSRVIDETSRDVILERARCMRLVEAAMKRFPDQPQIRCVLAGLLEDMGARRLTDAAVQDLCPEQDGE
jgi:hypothetical protein